MAWKDSFFHQFRFLKSGQRPRPCKILGLDFTKMFPVKHFGFKPLRRRRGRRQAKRLKPVLLVRPRRLKPRNKPYPKSS